VDELHTSTLTSKTALYAGSSMHGSNVLAAVACTPSAVELGTGDVLINVQSRSS
jgi:hypothetical protein